MNEDSDALAHGLRVSVFDDAAVVAAAISGRTLVAGETYSVGNGNHEGSVVDHWHANQDGDSPGVPLQIAEIGGLVSVVDGSDESCRGFAYIDITDLTSALTTAELSVRVYDVTDLSAVPVGGIFGNDQPYGASCEVSVWAHSGTPAVADYDATATAVTSFSSSGASAQDDYTVDITSGVNTLIAASATKLGIRMKTIPSDPPGTSNEAITFYDFRLAVNGGGSTDLATFFGGPDLLQRLQRTEADFAGSHVSGFISGWFKSTASTTQYIFSTADEGTSATYHMRLFLESTGALAFQQRNNDTQDHIRTATTGFNDGSWHHFAWNSDDFGYFAWVDGSEESLSVVTGSDSGDWFNDTPNRDNVIIGAYKDSGAVAGYFEGALDEIAVWNKKATQTEVDELYNSGQGVLMTAVSNGSVVIGSNWIPDYAWPLNHLGADRGDEIIADVTLTSFDQMFSATPIPAGVSP